MTDNTKYEVTQADRDAAAESFWNRHNRRGLLGPTYKAMRAGELDGHVDVQAFARHRLTSQPAQSDLVEACKQAICCPSGSCEAGQGDRPAHCAKDGFAKEAEAVAALSTPTAPQPDRESVASVLIEPSEPGSYKGDIFFGSDDHTTLGTHRWDGTRWSRLHSDTVLLLELLTMARQERERVREKLFDARQALSHPTTDTQSDAVREWRPVTEIMAGKVCIIANDGCSSSLALVTDDGEIVDGEDAYPLTADFLSGAQFITLPDNYPLAFMERTDDY